MNKAYNPYRNTVSINGLEDGLLEMSISGTSEDNTEEGMMSAVKEYMSETFGIEVVGKASFDIAEMWGEDNLITGVNKFYGHLPKHLEDAAFMPVEIARSMILS